MFVKIVQGQAKITQVITNFLRCDTAPPEPQKDITQLLILVNFDMCFLKVH